MISLPGITDPALDFWIVLALYGVFVQRWALALAWRNMQTARFFGQTTIPMILAVSHVRTNALRMFAVCCNLFLGIFALFDPPATASASSNTTPIGWILSLVLIIVEITYVSIATLEIRANIKLRKITKPTKPTVL